MASRKIKSSLTDITALSSALTSSGVDEAQVNKITEKLSRGSKLGFKDNMALLKTEKDILKTYQEKDKLINRMEKDYKSLSNAQKEDLAVLKGERKQLEENSKVIERYTQQLNDSESVIMRVATAVPVLGGALAALSVVVSAASRIIGFFTGLYDQWWNLQNDLIRSMSQFIQATGATSQEVQRFSEVTLELNETFMRLNGSAWAVTEAGSFLTSMIVPLRMNLAEMGGDATNMSLQFLMANRALGLSQDQIAGLFYTIRDGSMGAGEDIRAFRENMVELAVESGGNVSTMARDFVDSRGTLALFGDQAMRTFSDAERYANHFGIEVSRILSLTTRFSSFENASRSVNQLNAIFGTTISSMDLMLEQNPARQLDMILENIRSVGGAVNMYQRQALAEQLNMDADIVDRLLAGESMDEINRQAEERANSEERRMEIMMSAGETLAGIIDRTSSSMSGFWTIIQRATNAVIMSLSPVFGEIQGTAEEIGESIGNFVARLIETPEFTQMIRDIAEWFRELPGRIEELMPTWREYFNTAVENFPRIIEFARSFGSVLMDLLPVFQTIAGWMSSIGGFITSIANLPGPLGEIFGGAIGGTAGFMVGGVPGAVAGAAGGAAIAGVTEVDTEAMAARDRAEVERMNSANLGDTLLLGSSALFGGALGFALGGPFGMAAGATLATSLASNLTGITERGRTISEMSSRSRPGAAASPATPSTTRPITTSTTTPSPTLEMAPRTISPVSAAESGVASRTVSSTPVSTSMAASSRESMIFAEVTLDGRRVGDANVTLARRFGS